MSKKILIIFSIFVISVVLVIFFMMQKSSNSQSPVDVSMQEEKTTGQDLSDAVDQSRYVDYTPEKFAESSEKKRVFFFHAKWCPTCKAANIEFNNNLSKIPEGVILFKTDYDTQAQLKKKYTITYQHTFVQVDKDGNEISKWNGGGVDALLANIK